MERYKGNINGSQRFQNDVKEYDTVRKCEAKESTELEKKWKKVMDAFGIKEGEAVPDTFFSEAGKYLDALKNHRDKIGQLYPQYAFMDDDCIKMFRDFVGEKINEVVQQQAGYAVAGMVQNGDWERYRFMQGAFMLEDIYFRLMRYNDEKYISKHENKEQSFSSFVGTSKKAGRRQIKLNDKIMQKYQDDRIRTLDTVTETIIQEKYVEAESIPAEEILEKLKQMDVEEMSLDVIKQTLSLMKGNAPVEDIDNPSLNSEAGDDCAKTVEDNMNIELLADFLRSMPKNLRYTLIAMSDAKGKMKSKKLVREQKLIDYCLEDAIYKNRLEIIKLRKKGKGAVGYRLKEEDIDEMHDKALEMLKEFMLEQEFDYSDFGDGKINGLFDALMKEF